MNSRGHVRGILVFWGSRVLELLKIEIGMYSLSYQSRTVMTTSFGYFF